jgi:RHS repeat-associated protein
MLRSAATLPASGTGTYHHHDALGNVIALTNVASYAVLETYTYDPFGKRTVYNATGQQIPDTAYANTHGYTGREHLPLSGLMDYRNRTYSTTLGRFLQVDPIGFDAGDVNLYRYVGNNPINAIDLLGLMECPCGTHWGLNLDCYSDCIERYRNPLGNMISDAMGGAAAHLANAAGNLLAGPTGRTGVGGVKSHSTTWQHKLGSKLGPVGSKVGRFAGRAAIGATIFDGFFNLGLSAGCAIPSERSDECMECIPDV